MASAVIVIRKLQSGRLANEVCDVRYKYKAYTLGKLYHFQLQSLEFESAGLLTLYFY
jgi:hypothetical protein